MVMRRPQPRTLTATTSHIYHRSFRLGRGRETCAKRDILIEGCSREFIRMMHVPELHVCTRCFCDSPAAHNVLGVTRQLADSSERVKGVLRACVRQLPMPVGEGRFFSLSP